MIVVDSSVWIDHFRNDPTPQVLVLRALVLHGDAPLLVGDLVLFEVLQGARSDRDAARIEAELRRFPLVPVSDPHLAAKAAERYRALRSLGVTVRKSVDMLLGAFCIERGHVLLHDDRDFDPMEQHLGLRVVPVP